VGYDEARRVHNGPVDKRPALIARCLGVADVVDAVRLARNLGLEVAVRGSEILTVVQGPIHGSGARRRLPISPMGAADNAIQGTHPPGGQSTHDGLGCRPLT